MNKQTISLIALFAVFIPCDLFAVARWTDGGPGSDWTTAANWDAGYGNAPPVSSDTTYIRYADLAAGGRGPVIREGMDIEIKMLALEAAAGYIEVEMTGGSLYCSQNSGGDGIRLGAGAGSGLAVINMSGGTLTTLDQIRIGSGYPGRLLLSGDAAVHTGGLTIFSGSGLLDISSEAAVFHVSGDQTAAIQGYIQEGAITAFGGNGAVVYDFDQTLAGFTTLRAVADTAIFQQEWNDQGVDSLWTTGQNWSSGSMPENDETRVSIRELAVGKRGPVITADMTPPPGYETLVARGIRFEPPDSQTTVMTMEGGALSVSEEFWLIAGTSKGRAILEMHDGLLEIGTELRIGGWDSRGGHVQLDGGTIRAGALTLRANGSINIRSDGKLILDSDVSVSIQEAVDAGMVMAYNGTGQVRIEYDSTEDTTIVSAQMLSKEASVKVKVDRYSSWSADRRLWGRFFEHHGSDVYPGIYEQYLVNTSFEPWYHKDESSPTPAKDVKEWLVFRDVEETEGVAYPWEPFGVESNPLFELSSDSLNSETAQKIVHTMGTGDAPVGVAQRIMLPDYRTDQYRVRLFVKAEETVEQIEILLRDYGTKEIVDSVSFPASSQWQPVEGLLNLRGHRAASRRYGRQGIYELAVVTRDSGMLLLDQMTIFPTDAVNGCYNPETIEVLRDAGVTTIRWPGGNFASGYHWQDGIGPVDQRPTRPNLAWAGLENNHVGTDEFLEFCEIAGLTPIICVGFGYASVSEAAAWVEYVNGCPETTYYGALRAQNGRYDPYAIEIWQVGNEVYGSYQIGHTDAADYATRYLDYYDAMKAADPTIKMMAMGRDPGYHTDDENAWNKTLFQIIGDKMDTMDIHRYVRGIRNESDLELWDLTHLAEIYLSYPSQYETVVVGSIRELTKPEQYDLPDVKLAVTEWAQYLTVRTPRLPHSWSQANAVFYAGMLNVFLRNGDFARISCSHDFSAFINSREVPPSPRNAVARLYSQVSADRLLETEVVCDTFDMARPVTQMQTVSDLPYLDAVALRDIDNNQIVLFLINRSLTSGYQTAIELETMTGPRQAHLSVFSVGEDFLDYTPHCMAAQTWEMPRQFQITNHSLLVEGGVMTVDLPACSVVRVDISDINLTGFSLFAGHWLQETCAADNQWCRGADLDQSGEVTIHDLAACAESWLQVGFP